MREAFLTSSSEVRVEFYIALHSASPFLSSLECICKRSRWIRDCVLPPALCAGVAYDIVEVLCDPSVGSRTIRLRRPAVVNVRTLWGLAFFNGKV